MGAKKSPSADSVAQLNGEAVTQPSLLDGEAGTQPPLLGGGILPAPGPVVLLHTTPTVACALAEHDPNVVDNADSGTAKRARVGENATIGSNDATPLVLTQLTQPMSQTQPPAGMENFQFGC